MTTVTDDVYDLQRFIDAQEACLAQVHSELAAGEKSSHWMWFIFPQIRGLGSSAMAQRFAISNLDEAVAYLTHSLLGARLRDCARMVIAVRGHTIEDIFGYPDDLKFHSSVTLFAKAASILPQLDSANQVFTIALAKYFKGVPDQATLDRL
jgi:uncharacterized protein (DUF1810 family)